FLAPAEIDLDEVVVRPKVKLTWGDDGPENVQQVADPIGVRVPHSTPSRCWEREEEVQRIVGRLRNDRSSFLVVGAHGVGKSAVIQESVRRVLRAEKEASEPIRGRTHRYWSTSAARIIAGMKYLGQWERRCELLIEDLGEVSVVLFVERLSDLLRTGGDASIAGFLQPYVEREELRLVCEATSEELDAARRVLPGFVDLFQVESLANFQRGPALRLLDRQAADVSQNRKITSDPELSDLVYRLHSRFLPFSMLFLILRPLAPRVVVRSSARSSVSSNPATGCADPVSDSRGTTAWWSFSNVRDSTSATVRALCSV
ncbi:MAG: hypothetical protein AAF517_28030, partial [Planctomycetota bacterium]